MSCKTINIDLANVPPVPLRLGVAGENAFRTIAFDASTWGADFPDATYTVVYKRSDGYLYPVLVNAAADAIVWSPTDTDTAVSGNGQLEVRLLDGETIGKTIIMRTYVAPSLSGDESEPSTPAPDWVNDVADDADRAEAAVSHYPKIVNGVWFVWNAETGEFVSTGISAQGEDGVSPTVTVTEIDGGHRVTITDADGAHTFDVMDGDGGSGAADAVLYTPQTLTPAQQAQARENIGAAAVGEGGGLTDAIKQALLDCFENVAWINDDGQTYYDALYAALYPPKTLVSISAAFDQGSAVIYDTDDLDTLKQYLTVTAIYDDTSTGVVTNYTLSGTLTVGTSTITVSYGGKTTTFTVTVTHDEGHSDMTGWADGVAYTNLEIVENEYAQGSNGAILQYSGWNRTGYVPCHGASTLVVPTLPQEGNKRIYSNWFYDENHNPVSGGLDGFELSRTQPTTVTVPSGAYYFIISSNASALTTCINNGIVPNA